MKVEVTIIYDAPNNRPFGEYQVYFGDKYVGTIEENNNRDEYMFFDMNCQLSLSQQAIICSAVASMIQEKPLNYENYRRIYGTIL
jgi:hypothetical protein